MGVFLSGLWHRPDFSLLGENPTPPPRPKAGSEEALLKVSTFQQPNPMIAANYRRFADALIAQLELDFSGTVGADEKQRAAWWSWLMNAGIVQPLPARARPVWWVALRKAAAALARAVRAAIEPIF